MAEEKSGGCLKIFFVVFGLFILATAGASYFIYKHSGDFIRGGSASMVEVMGGQLVAAGNYSEQEKSEIQKPFKEFAEEIRAGRVSLEDGIAVLTEITNGETWILLSIETLINTHLKQSALSPELREQIELSLRRFGEGVRNGKIGLESARAAMSEVSTVSSSAGEAQVSELEEDISDKNLRALGERAKALADQAGIEVKMWSFNIPKEISEAIDRGIRIAGESKPAAH